MDNNEFFKTVDSTTSSPKSKIGFFKCILIPFISGILGTLLILGICIEVPSIRTRLLDSLNDNESTISTTKDKQNSTSYKDSETTSVSNTNLISLEDYSNTGIYAANKVLPSIVGITVEYTVNSPYYGY